MVETKLMVSVTNAAEAGQAVEGGADVVDIKNPAEGPLGAAGPAAIREVASVLPADMPLGIALGDFAGKVGGAALAALGACSFSPGYIKIAFTADCGVDEVRACLEEMRQAILQSGSRSELIACIYADTVNTGKTGLSQFVRALRPAGADGCLLDTCIKDGRSLPDWLSINQLRQFALDCRKEGLLCAMAGSLQKRHIQQMLGIKPDIIGMRGAVCAQGDRLQSGLSVSAIAEIKSMLRSTE